MAIVCNCGRSIYCVGNQNSWTGYGLNIGIYRNPPSTDYFAVFIKLNDWFGLNAWYLAKRWISSGTKYDDFAATGVMGVCEVT